MKCNNIVIYEYHQSQLARKFKDSFSSKIKIIAKLYNSQLGTIKPKNLHIEITHLPSIHIPFKTTLGFINFFYKAVLKQFKFIINHQKDIKQHAEIISH